MLIYKITNTINGMFYIGKTTKSLAERFNRHIARKSSPKLYAAIHKYGPENFTIEQIDLAKSKEELNEKERTWIEKTEAISKGYNLALGGDGGPMIGESLEKIRSHAKSRRHSAITRERMGISRTGVKNGRSKKVLVVAEDGTQTIFDSIKQASDFLGFSHSTGMAMAKGIKASKKNISIRILE